MDNAREIPGKANIGPGTKAAATSKTNARVAELKMRTHGGPDSSNLRRK